MYKHLEVFELSFSCTFFSLFCFLFSTIYYLSSLQDRSKNSRFLRYGENAGSQEGKSTVDNFHHYGLRSKLRALIGVDAALWREGDSSVSRDVLAGYSGCDSAVDIEKDKVVDNEVEVEESNRIRGSERGSGDSKSKHQQRGTWGMKEVERGSLQDSDIERPYGWHEDLDQYGQVCHVYIS
jgi:hypothetical protein